MITNAAMKNGFTGGVIIDYPNSKKAKKYFLQLMAGFSEEVYLEAKSVLMPAKTDEPEEDSSDEDENGRKYKKKEKDITMFGSKRNSAWKKKKQYHSEFGQVKSKSWILAKKDRARKQGKHVVNDSKFSGRKRASKF